MEQQGVQAQDAENTLPKVINRLHYYAQEFEQIHGHFIKLAEDILQTQRTLQHEKNRRELLEKQLAEVNDHLAILHHDNLRLEALLSEKDTEIRELTQVNLELTAQFLDTLTETIDEHDRLESDDVGDEDPDGVGGKSEDGRQWAQMPHKAATRPSSNQPQGPLKGDGTPDWRYKENRRYKANKELRDGGSDRSPTINSQVPPGDDADNLLACLENVKRRNRTAAAKW